MGNPTQLWEIISCLVLPDVICLKTSLAFLTTSFVLGNICKRNYFVCFLQFCVKTSTRNENMVNTSIYLHCCPPHPLFLFLALFNQLLSAFSLLKEVDNCFFFFNFSVILFWFLGEIFWISQANSFISFPRAFLINSCLLPRPWKRLTIVLAVSTLGTPSTSNLKQMFQDGANFSTVFIFFIWLFSSGDAFWYHISLKFYLPSVLQVGRIKFWQIVLTEWISSKLTERISAKPAECISSKLHTTQTSRIAWKKMSITIWR